MRIDPGPQTLILFHLIYVSRAARDIGSPNLIEILTASRARNAEMGVSGLLLFSEDSFIQVLEGGQTAVENVFASIARDPRHHGVTVLVREPIKNRNFSGWSMGFERLPNGLPPAVAGAFKIERDGLRDRLGAAALEVKSFIHGFLHMSALQGPR